MPTQRLPKRVFPNPKVLNWAASLVSDPESLKIRQEWLTGDSFPTYRQLSEVAKRLGVSLTTFFLPEPPEQPLIPVSFRRRYAENAELDRTTLRELKKLFDLKERLVEFNITSDLSLLNELTALLGQGASVQEVARRCNELMGFSLKEQVACRDNFEALNQARDRVEMLGAFVIQASFKERAVNGICIADESSPPLIVIRGGDRPTVRQFTLAHELYHAIERESSVFSLDEGRTQECLQTEDKANQFAAELLLPEASPVLKDEIGDFDGTKEHISHVARKFKYSYSFVLMRYRDLLKLPAEKVSELWVSPKKKSKNRSGNYYRNQKVRFGSGIASQVWDRYDRGDLSTSQVCQLFEVKVENLERFRAESD